MQRKKREREMPEPEFTITLGDNETRCYKYDEPCCMCPDQRIVLLQLTLDEVKGHDATLKMNDIEKDGFICEECLSEVKKDSNFILKM